jgi:hypothetical protein
MKNKNELQCECENVLKDMMNETTDKQFKEDINTVLTLLDKSPLKLSKKSIKQKKIK